MQEYSDKQHINSGQIKTQKSKSKFMISVFGKIQFIMLHNKAEGYFAHDRPVDCPPKIHDL